MAINSNDQREPDLASMLVSTAEAARLLGTTERHLRRLRERHGLRAVALGGKVRYRRADLAAFVESCRDG